MSVKPSPQRIAEAVDGIVLSMVTPFREELRERGLTVLQFAVLKHLAREGTTWPSSLAQRLGVRPPTICTFIDSLEAGGWVRRTTGREDRRTVILRLAPKGARLVASLGAAQARRLREATRGIPSGDLARTAQVMEHVRAQLAERYPAREEKRWGS